MVFLLYPCLCLCRLFGQITRTTPLRRMILHLLHIFLTDALTFMAASPCSITVRHLLSCCQVLGMTASAQLVVVT